jgi:hypothetical protein
MPLRRKVRNWNRLRLKNVFLLVFSIARALSFGCGVACSLGVGVRWIRNLGWCLLLTLLSRVVEVVGRVIVFGGVLVRRLGGVVCF